MATICRPASWRQLWHFKLRACRLKSRAVPSPSRSSKPIDPRLLHQILSPSSSLTYRDKQRTAEAPSDESQNLDAVPTSSQSIEQHNSREGLTNQVRQFMRHMAHPVVLVTTSAPTSSPDKDFIKSHDFEHCFGATISSFSTVSLGSPPYIIFNLRRPSRTLQSILEHEYFRLTAIRSGVEGEQIATAFLNHQHKDAFEFLQSKFFKNAQFKIENTPIRSRSEDGGTLAAVDGTVYAPKLTGPGLLGSFDCQAILDKCIEVGDHTLVVAEVLTVSEKPHDAIDGARSSSLIYYHQNFGVPSRSSVALKDAGKEKASGQVLETEPETMAGREDIDDDTYFISTISTRRPPKVAEPESTVQEDDNDRLNSLASQNPLGAQGQSQLAGRPLRRRPVLTESTKAMLALERQNTVLRRRNSNLKREIHGNPLYMKRRDLAKLKREVPGHFKVDLINSQNTTDADTKEKGPPSMRPKPEYDWNPITRRWERVPARRRQPRVGKKKSGCYMRMVRSES